MYRYTFVLILALLIGTLRGIGSQAQSRTSCDDISFSATESVGVLAGPGQPGDTVWATVYVNNDSILVGFCLTIRYDPILLSPLISGDGAPLFQRLGRLIGSPDFFLAFSEIPEDSGAIVAAFNLQYGTDSIVPGSDPVFRIPFVINESAAAGDSARFWFPRVTEYVIDWTVFPPDTLQATCRGSQFSEIYNDSFTIASIWPTGDDSYLHISYQTPILSAFYVEPRSVWTGDQVRVHWVVSNCDSVVLEPGHVVSTDTLQYLPTYPDTTALYTLTVYRGPNTIDTSILVHVVPPGENRYPWLWPPAPVTVTVGNAVSQSISAFDPDTMWPIMTADSLPGDATFTDYGDGYARLRWTPTPGDIGTYVIMLFATDRADASLVDSLPFSLTVVEANYPPSGTFDTQLSVLYERDTLAVTITASDPNGVPPHIVAHTAGGAPLAPNMTFIDLGDGTGLFRFVPDLFQGNSNPNLYYLGFTLVDAADPSLSVETSVKPIRVYNRNSGEELPQIEVPAESLLIVTEGDSLAFDVFSSTAIGDVPVLTSGPLPSGALLTNAPGTTLGNHKILRYYPGWDQAGTHDVTLIAANADLVDSLVITLTVLDGNQPPWLFVPPGQPDTITEGSIYHMHVTAFDFDGTTPSLSAHLDGEDTLATNMTFADSGNGGGLLTFAPDLTQGSSCMTIFYYVKFRARDAVSPYPEASSATYTIKLFDSGVGCCVGSVGDIDYNGGGAGEPNIADLTRLIGYLFRSEMLPCPNEADIDGGGISISDITALVAYLFAGGGPLPLCP